jgi:hypothetical protein
MVVFMRCISQHAGPRNQYGHAACGVPRLHAYLQAEKNSEEEKNMLFLFHSSLLSLLRQGKTLRAAPVFINVCVCVFTKTAQCHTIRTAR